MVTDTIGPGRSRSLPFADLLAATPADAPSQRRFYLGLALLVLAGWVVRWLALGPPVFPIDDAYITLHNAQVLLAGFDRNYPGSPALSGATSAAHLALVAALLRCLPPLWALEASQWIGLLLYSLGLARLAFVHRASLSQAALLVIGGLILARAPHQLFNGLETGLAMAGVVWALALAADESGSRRRILSLLSGLLPFLRPELAVLSLMFLALQARQRWECRSSTAEALRGIGCDLLLCLAGAAPWMLWYAVSTGAPYPSTIAAKQAFFAEGVLPAATKMAWMSHRLALFAGSLGLYCAAVALLPRTRLGWVGLTFAAILLGAYYVDFPSAVGRYEHRYLYVLIPFLLYAGAACFAATSLTVRRLGTLLVAVVVMQSLWSFLPRWEEHMESCDLTATELEGAAVWCRQHLPANATLMIHDAGYLAYRTSFHLVDFVGLKSPACVPYHQRETLPTGGKGRASALNQIAIATHPGYLVVLRPWDEIFTLTSGLRNYGWKLSKLRDSAWYEVYQMSPPQIAKKGSQTAYRVGNNNSGTERLPGG